MDKKLETRIARLEKLLVNEDADTANIAKLAKSLDRYINMAAKFIYDVDSLVTEEDDDAISELGRLWNAEYSKCDDIHRHLLSLVKGIR